MVEIPCSFRSEDSPGKPVTLSCSVRSLEILRAYGCLERGNGLFTSAYEEKKKKEKSLERLLYLSRASKE